MIKTTTVRDYMLSCRVEVEVADALMKVAKEKYGMNRSKLMRELVIDFLIENGVELHELIEA